MICPVCGSSRQRQRYSFPWGRIIRCKDCTAAFTCGVDLDTENCETFANCHDDGSVEVFRQWASERLSAVQRFIKEGTLLEFGSGTGEFLYMAASAGFKTIGIDRFARLRPENKHPHVSLIQTDARAFQVRASFDVVAAVHVLEHFPDPYQLLSRVRENLKDSGFFLVEVPNFSSMSRAISGRRWRCFVRYHALQFTPQSLRVLLAKARFRVLSLESVGCSTTQLLGLGIPFIARRMGLTAPVNWQPGTVVTKLATAVERSRGWGLNLRAVAQKL
jgi:ubiquinone/menaquinone biosynthesis C-methylase UbiE